MQKTSFVNHIHFVIDRSFSMACFASQVKQQTNSLLKEIPVAIPGVENRVSITSFSGRSNITRDIVDGDPVFVNFDHYIPSGMTAIAKTLRQVLTDIVEQRRRTDQRNRAWLIYLTTDGDDNESSSLDVTECRSLLLSLKDVVTVAAFVPVEHCKIYVENLGVPSGNIQIWNVSADGLQNVASNTSASMRTYADMRKNGQTSTDSLFRPNVASVSEAVKAGNLSEYSGQHRTFDVLTNCEISAFITSKIGHYPKGHAYYQLTKAEDLGATKNILIRHKKTGKLYHGANARTVLGLPSGKTRISVSKQGGEYDIFVQSTSLNRKLIGGTKVILLG